MGTLFVIHTLSLPLSETETNWWLTTVEVDSEFLEAEIFIARI